MVRVEGLEPPASWSQTTRATNCAIPGYILYNNMLEPMALLLEYYTTFFQMLQVISSLMFF